MPGCRCASFAAQIFWLNIGKEPRPLAERVTRVASLLNQPAVTGDGTTATLAYRTLLEGKSVLLVLDDVWSRSDVEPFLLDPGSNSRVLYTSRDRSFAGQLGAATQEVDILTPEQAREFLRRWSGRESDISTVPEPWATLLIGECKGLTLALAIMGADLKTTPTKNGSGYGGSSRRLEKKQRG